MGISRLVAIALASSAGIGSLVARVAPSHWQLFELMLVVGCAALISRFFSSRKSLLSKVPVTTSRAAWFAGLPADLRDISARNFHPWDVEQAAVRSAALVAFPTRRAAAGAKQSVEQVAEDMLTHAFHS